MSSFYLAPTWMKESNTVRVYYIEWMWFIFPFFFRLLLLTDYCMFWSCVVHNNLLPSVDIIKSDLILQVWEAFRKVLMFCPHLTLEQLEQNWFWEWDLMMTSAHKFLLNIAYKQQLWNKNINLPVISSIWGRLDCFCMYLPIIINVSSK